MRRESHDIEVGLADNDPEGYARLATLMGCAPETTIFRRFGSLSTLSLLRKQAKIHELEITLNQYRQEDRKSGHRDRARYDRNFELLERSGDEDAIEEGNNGAQLDILEEIEEKLKDYEEALLRHRELLNLGHASPRQVKYLDTWMQRPRLGNISLLGSDKNIWTDKDLLDDLVALAAKTEEESFTNRFTLWATHVYNRFIGRYIHRAEAEESIFRNTIRYTNTGTFRVFKTLSAISASLLPVVGIIVLYFINSIEGRIGAIAGFTFLFSLSLSIITSATVKDIFVAAATFAAVLVVFVGATEQSCRAATTEPISEIFSRR